MYLDFYKFRQKPFQINTDPKLYWFGEKNTEAFKLFASVLNEKKGISVLTGDSGTGKTTFINLLINTLPSNTISGIVHDPSFNEIGFSRYLAHIFSLRSDFHTLKEFYHLFKRFLFKSHIRRKSVVLVVEEAQKLNQKNLDIIVKLSEIKHKKVPLISIVLVGQNDFLSILNKLKNRGLRKKLNLNHQLEFLSETETNDYIQFRLYASGIQENLFTQGAIKRIFMLSNGSPHKINIIADYALLSGYINETRYINESLVDVFTHSFDLHKTDIVQPESTSSGDEIHVLCEKKPVLNPPALRHSKKVPDLNFFLSPTTTPVSQNVFRFHSQDLRVLKQMARFYIENKNLEEAELYIEKILENNEGVVDTLMMKGELHILKNEYEDAIEIFNRILAKDPLNVHSYYFKALAHMKNYDILVAKATIATALSINPKFNKGKSLLEKINSVLTAK